MDEKGTGFPRLRSPAETTRKEPETFDHERAYQQIKSFADSLFDRARRSNDRPLGSFIEFEREGPSKTSERKAYLTLGDTRIVVKRSFIIDTSANKPLESYEIVSRRRLSIPPDTYEVDTILAWGPWIERDDQRCMVGRARSLEQVDEKGEKHLITPEENKDIVIFSLAKQRHGKREVSSLWRYAISGAVTSALENVPVDNQEIRQKLKDQLENLLATGITIDTTRIPRYVSRNEGKQIIKISSTIQSIKDILEFGLREALNPSIGQELLHEGLKKPTVEGIISGLAENLARTLELNERQKNFIMNRMGELIIQAEREDWGDRLQREISKKWEDLFRKFVVKELTGDELVAILDKLKRAGLTTPLKADLSLVEEPEILQIHRAQGFKF